MKNHFAKMVMLFGAPIYLTNPTVSFAQAPQANSNKIETVTVTGIRQAYRGDFTVLETPQSELVIDAVTLQNAGAFDLNQALDLSSSVARQNNFGGLWNSFAVRGFIGDENLPSNYLVNGFNAGRGFGGPRDLSGIEAVEVLKGPRAALFGRGEPGGTINLVTKRPTFSEKGEIRVTAGSFNFYRTDLDYNTTLSSDVAVRIVGFYEDADSFRDTIETKKQGLSPSIIWKPTQQSQLSYEIEYSSQEIPFDRGVVAIDGDIERLPISRFLGEPGDGPMQADVLGHQIEYQHDFSDNWSALVGFNRRNTSLEGFATENGFFGGRQFLSRDGENLTRFRRFRDYDATYEVLRAEISGSFETGNIDHRIIIGLDADKFENDQVFLRARGSSINNDAPIEDELERLRVTNQVINVFNPIYGAFPLPEPGANTDRVETQESQGFYLQDQISFSDSFDLRIGFRYDDYEQELNNRRSESVTTQSETRISPQLGVVFKTTDTVSIYASYGENFRPLSGVDATTNQGFDPNDSTSVEVGVNFALNDGKIEGNIALFRVEQSNISGVVASDNFDPVAIGEAQSQGLEIDINGEIAEGLNVWASYAYIDAEVSTGFFDPNFGANITPGSPLLNIPEQQLSLLLAKEVTVDDQKLVFGAGFLYVDDRNGFFGTDFELPSYTTIRAFAAYDITKDVTLRLDIDNLFDEQYYSNSFADVWVQPGTPVNARLSALFTF